MNELQEQIFDVIVSLLNGKSFATFASNGAIRYGLLNYVAKYSLANDQYYATPAAYDQLCDFGFLRPKGLRRGVKSRRNQFTYEHVIPASVIVRELLKFQGDVSRWRDILVYSDCVTILTAAENSRLNASLRSSMPKNFEFLVSDPFERYTQAGLPGIDELEKVSVFGALRR